MDSAAKDFSFLGATTALCLGASSAYYLPRLAAALNGPVSAGWFAATSVVATVGMYAGQAAKERFYPE